MKTFVGVSLKETMVDSDVALRIGVVGCRYFSDRVKLEKTLDEMIAPGVVEIVSGGCSGVDSLAVGWARRKGYAVKVFKANWALGAKAGPIRNTQIVDYVNFVIAFPSKTSKGTYDTIKKAETAGKLFAVIDV